MPKRPANPRRRRRQRSGQSMVEFALVGPLIVLLLMAVVDLGRGIFYQVELNNAVREATRIAILASNPCNTYVGNNGGCTGPQMSGVSGTTLCQGLSNETNLVSVFNDCADNNGAGTGFLSSLGSANCHLVGTNTACSGNASQAYVEVNQATTGGTCSTAVITPASGYSTAVPRNGGNLVIQVKVVYFYRPITPFLSSLFPTNFYLYSSACARPEY